MPPKTKTISLPANQNSINLFFSKPTAIKAAVATTATVTKPVDKKISGVVGIDGDDDHDSHDSHDDPKITAFMASLSANELLAHKLAVEKLGTSYDITRTHGFKNWSNRA